MKDSAFDEIHYWSEIKLDIVKDYASAYSTIMAARRNPPLYHVYIDAFAGAGVHISKDTGEYVAGSPINALLVKPKFREYHFIDLDSEKIDMLRSLSSGHSNVSIHEGDCNALLLEKVFPRALYKNYKRALCLLDPYGLHLNWEVIQEAGEMESVDMFLNFPVADMNRNVLWRNPDKVDPKQAARMTAYWGDETWRSVAYNTTLNLFGWEQKTDNETVAEAFRERLKKVAGFKFVPPPMPMRNSRGAIVYYLFFASHKLVAENILNQIFNKHRNRGAI